MFNFRENNNILTDYRALNFFYIAKRDYLTNCIHNYCMNIKFFRKKLDLNQIELAKKLNVSRSAISRYEKGESDPPVEILCKLADIFGVSVDTIVGHQSNMLDFSSLDPNQQEAIKLIRDLPKAKVDKVVGFCQALMENEN